MTPPQFICAMLLGASFMLIIGAYLVEAVVINPIFKRWEQANADDAEIITKLIEENHNLTLNLRAQVEENERLRLSGEEWKYQG